ncbi:MAG: RNA polymerase-associated protein RapA, partial [Gammaproteobacteria bacterium]|nr:RNA polymerase-associated protein RapA [Gammaproteobacteria bacterium]
RKEAPLIRVTFSTGDLIKNLDGLELSVIEAHADEGVLTYLCQALDGTSRRIPETELHEHLRLNQPVEKLMSGRIDRDSWFTLRYQTWLQTAKESASSALGLGGARVGLIPHQIYIAAEVTGQYAPRVLLADEVGLGKTIEAGLIMHRLVLTERVNRILVVVPEPLLHQWLVEMLRRFNLRFALFGKERFDAADSEAPFLEEQHVLCSLEFLISKPEVARAALAGDWDLLVVDEAHHLEWCEQEASLEYALVEALASETHGVLLLTATPEQLGRAGHFGRLRLLDPHRFHDYQAFLNEEQQYAPVAALAARMREGKIPTTADRELLISLLGEPLEKDPALLLERLMDRHGTGRALYRNTRAAIQGFPGREFSAYPLPLPDAYADPDTAALADPTPEVHFVPNWIGIDPRVTWLSRTLRELRPEKVLVICAHAETVLTLRTALLERVGIHAAVFHERMEIVERDRAAAYFADAEEGTQVLLCSEIGSEGRNFQFAHHLILFDLPVEADLLEQRIGRLDRIGQTETIQLHLPYLEDSAGEVLFHWYAKGLDAFSSPCPAAGAVYSQLHAELLAALENPTLTHALVAKAAILRKRLNTELETGRDRLLELHSHRPTESSAMVQLISAQDGGYDVKDYMTRYWDAYGVEHEEGPGRSTVLHPGRHMLHDKFPGMSSDGATVTFDRGNALTHEDREFLTWEHPMVRGAMEALTGSDLGTTAISVLDDPRFKQGALLLELIYVAECSAPPKLGVKRFLPPTALRLLLDAQGRDHAGRFTHETLQGECLNRNRQLATAVIKSQTPRLRKMFEQGEELALRAVGKLEVDGAREMRRVLGEELDRLRALAEVNAWIRPEELERLEARRELLVHYLGKTRVYLDAARVVVAG